MERHIILVDDNNVVDVNPDVYPFNILTLAGLSALEVKKVNALYVDFENKGVFVDKADFFQKVIPVLVSKPRIGLEQHEILKKQHEIADKSLIDAVKCMEHQLTSTHYKKKHKQNSGLNIGSYKFKSKTKKR